LGLENQKFAMNVVVVRVKCVVKKKFSVKTTKLVSKFAGIVKKVILKNHALCVIKIWIFMVMEDIMMEMVEIVVKTALKPILLNLVIGVVNHVKNDVDTGSVRNVLTLGGVLNVMKQKVYILTVQTPVTTLVSV
jgi:hypothetical protein